MYWVDFPRGELLRRQLKDGFCEAAVYAFIRDARDFLDRRGAAIEETLAVDKENVLVFHPFQATFEGVLELETDGFFDNSDCPAPEFWASVGEEILVAYIPEQIKSCIHDLAAFSINGSLTVQSRADIDWC